MHKNLGIDFNANNNDNNSINNDASKSVPRVNLDLCVDWYSLKLDC